MTAALIIRSFFEFAAIVLVMVGFINEKKLIAFEDRLIRAIRIHVRNYRKRKAYEARMAQRKVQSRAPAAEPEEAVAVTVVTGKKSIHRVA